MRPRCSVAIARPEQVSGSNEVTVALRFNAAIGMFSTPEMIGHEPGVERPRSRVCAKRIRC